MNGRRCKILRKRFEAVNGRPPRKAGWSDAEETTHEYRSRSRTRLGWFWGKVRKIVVRTVKIRSASEWRQVKKAYRERRAA